MKIFASLIKTMRDNLGIISTDLKAQSVFILNFLFPKMEKGARPPFHNLTFYGTARGQRADDEKGGSQFWVWTFLCGVFDID